VDLLCSRWGGETLRLENVTVKKHCWVVEVILEVNLNTLVKNWISSECLFNLRLPITPGSDIYHCVESDLAILVLVPTGGSISEY